MHNHNEHEGNLEETDGASPYQKGRVKSKKARYPRNTSRQNADETSSGAHTVEASRKNPQFYYDTGSDMNPAFAALVGDAVPAEFKKNSESITPTKNESLFRGLVPKTAQPNGKSLVRPRILAFVTLIDQIIAFFDSKCF